MFHIGASLALFVMFLDEELPGVGGFGMLLMLFSYILIILLFPLSLFYTIKVSQISKYEVNYITEFACNHIHMVCMFVDSQRIRESCYLEVRAAQITQSKGTR